ncbi:DNA excision repair protein Ercc1 isoform X2 [Tachypleus tridentatus]|uniref:DNA excision repair protein Ercc1 isoform X2 n=1 Tax=Tachypleus tridentatus TaxID=6853 RepID=UPI003FD6B2F3
MRVVQVQQHFQPGLLLAGSITNKEVDKCPVQQKGKGDSSSNIENTNVPDHKEHLDKNCPELSTTFESAFVHLKNSKYYSLIPPGEKKIPETSVHKQAKPSKNTILVNPRQKGNPLLKSIRNVPWEFSEIEPDYVMGQTTCALFLRFVNYMKKHFKIEPDYVKSQITCTLFLSLRYHSLFPNYIHDRLKALGKSYQLRVLLVQVDVTDPHPTLKELSKIAILADCTLMLAWSPEEAGRYVETYKVFENKSAEFIMEKQEDDLYSQLVDALTTVKSINRTDAMSLLSMFGSLEKIVEASENDLSLCPGIGPQKAARLHWVLHQPFIKSQGQHV